MRETARQVTVEEVLAETDWLRALARDLVGNSSAADDVVQETLVTALQRRTMVRRSLRGWLRRVARNVFLAERRAESRRKTRERVVGAKSGSGSVADTVARAEEHRRVVDAALSLEEPFRSTVLLRYFDGLSPSEIAVRTGIDPATVRSRLHRARGRLRTHLSAGRADWRVALITLLTVSAGGRVAAAAGGGFAVTATTKIALTAAAVVVLAGGGVFIASQSGGGPPPPAVPADGSPVVADRTPDPAPVPPPAPVASEESEPAALEVEKDVPADEPAKPLTPPAPPAADATAAVKVKLEAIVSMEVSGKSLRTALALLAAFAEVEFDTNLLSEADLDAPVSFKFDQARLSDILEFICAVKGHEYEVGPRGITIR